MKGTIRLDHLNKNILITTSFARASMNPENCEYNNDCKNAVCVANGDQSTVIICGNDLDTLNEMAKTVKFK